MPNFAGRYLRVRVWPEWTQIPIEFTQDWKVTFRVHKCSSAGAFSWNTAEINLYNITSKLRDIMSHQYLPVEIDAGYLYNHAIIFKGYIYNLTTIKQAPDLITTLYCASNKQVAGKPVNVCVQNMKVTDLLIKLCEENGYKYVLPFTREDVIQGSYSGSFSRILAQICSMYNISCSVVNDTIVFSNKLVKEEDVTKDEIKIFTPSSGLIGNPAVTEQGVRFTSLLQPTLEVNDVFRLEAPYADYNVSNLQVAPGLVLGDQLNIYAHIDTRTYNGVYMALSLVETGDTRGNSWYTEVEGSKLWPKSVDAE